MAITQISSVSDEYIIGNETEITISSKYKCSRCNKGMQFDQQYCTKCYVEVL